MIPIQAIASMPGHLWVCDVRQWTALIRCFATKLANSALHCCSAAAAAAAAHLWVCEVVQRGVGQQASSLHGVKDLMVPAGAGAAAAKW
jgi:hypothetical protein